MTSWRGCVLPVLAALVLRLAFLFIAFPLAEARLGTDYARMGYDSDGYRVIAASILAGKYHDVQRAPAFPFLVAAVDATLGESVTAFRSVQVAMDAATAGLIFIAGERLAPGTRTGPAAAWLYAIYPLAWWRCAHYNKETLQTFALVLLLLIILRALASGSVRDWFLCGLMLSALNLIKPIFLLLPAPLALWFYLFRDRVRPVASCAALVAGLAVVIGPWTARNYALTGMFVPVALEKGGLTLFVGNHDANLGAWEGEHKADWERDVKAIYAAHPDADDVQIDPYFRRAAVQRILSYPAKFVEMFVLKAWRFWFANASGRASGLVIAVQLCYVGLALAGLVLGRLERVHAVLLALIPVYVCLLHAAIYADVRFSLPVMPCLMLLGGSVPLTSRER